MKFAEAVEVFRTKNRKSFHIAAEAVLKHVRSFGLSVEETAVLAVSIANSGEKISLKPRGGPYADVPSTGGPGSLSTLLCPLLIASRGVSVPKISASGSIAGAIDTMALIPGYRSKLPFSEFLRVLQENRFAHTEQTDDLCPADKILIKLRRKANLMANPYLAAASLLGKKLIFGGGKSIFPVYDLRVGPAGNIGNTQTEAREAAKIFLAVGELVGAKISCILTDNRSFPCTAVGRLESLQLLWDVVSGVKLNSLDKNHVNDCVYLAARACSLAKPMENWRQHRTAIKIALKNGKVRDLLSSHLQAQGAEAKGLEVLLVRAKKAFKVQIGAARDGFWVPPPIIFVSELIKKGSLQLRELDLQQTNEAERALGIHLTAVPGQFVEAGQPVLEIRVPRGFNLDCSGLEGGVQSFPGAFAPEFLGFKKWKN